MGEVEKDKVERLAKIFELEGCNRLNPAHSIPGSISADILRSALQYSDLSTEDLRSISVECLQGKHRLAALRERSEGHIFLNILKHPLASPNAKIWLGRLGTKSRADIAKRLYRHNSLAGALRIVLKMPGQRRHFKLGAWKRIITEGCDEEISHYLRLIYDTFAFIMGSDTVLKFVDKETVHNFELRAPGASHQDELYVSAVVSNNSVLGRLRTIQYLIPTRLISGRDRLPFTVQSLARDAFTLPHASAFSPEAEFLGNLKELYLHIMQNIVQLAIRAKDKGFDSDEISRLCSIDLDRKEARPIQHKPGSAELTTTRHAEPVARRCGRQYSKAYARDRHFYTPDWFTCVMQKGSDITSLFIRRSVFHAFWGFHDITEGDGSGHDDDMVDAAEEIAVPGERNQPADLPAPTGNEDEEMRDAPAFSKHRKPRRPRQTLVKKTARLDRHGDMPVAMAEPRERIRRVPAHSEATPSGVVADRSSAVTTFIPAGPDHRQMTILLRKDGEWVDARRYRRASIIQGIFEVRRENQGQKLRLYKQNGRGIEAKDCPTLHDDSVYLSTDASGFPAEEIL
ncbi:hypothetical protein SODALDRAFT_400815 [Sodiomyces alkalinus F11]|uniref:Uncharacterized protein n=1 Tax=Sodiomyces alkalinus (strain CBS 110278 / VKM F-3762 / F11) TaxID=1314773 RepID=A0A3N2PRH7_SODAK|nr:hypothetical protein SODALDRAFT_400815 [Sodiomyces alkalinus F11]ROT37121.1 hypothetical protein SODALDRAFT_400815 [Sodiomyces alkalinus F11]